METQERPRTPFDEYSDLFSKRLFTDSNDPISSNGYIRSVYWIRGKFSFLKDNALLAYDLRLGKQVEIRPGQLLNLIPIQPRDLTPNEAHALARYERITGIEVKVAQSQPKLKPIDKNEFYRDPSKEELIAYEAHKRVIKELDISFPP